MRQVVECHCLSLLMVLCLLRRTIAVSTRTDEFDDVWRNLSVSKDSDDPFFVGAESVSTEYKKLEEFGKENYEHNETKLVRETGLSDREADADASEDNEEDSTVLSHYETETITSSDPAPFDTLEHKELDVDLVTAAESVATDNKPFTSEATATSMQDRIDPDATVNGDTSALEQGPSLNDVTETDVTYGSRTLRVSLEEEESLSDVASQISTREENELPFREEQGHPTPGTSTERDSLPNHTDTEETPDIGIVTESTLEENGIDIGEATVESVSETEGSITSSCNGEGLAEPVVEDLMGDIVSQETDYESKGSKPPDIVLGDEMQSVDKEVESDDREVSSIDSNSAAVTPEVLEADKNPSLLPESPSHEPEDSSENEGSTLVPEDEKEVKCDHISANDDVAGEDEATLDFDRLDDTKRCKNIMPASSLDGGHAGVTRNGEAAPVFRSSMAQNTLNLNDENDFPMRASEQPVLQGENEHNSKQTMQPKDTAQKSESDDRLAGEPELQRFETDQPHHDERQASMWGVQHKQQAYREGSNMDSSQRVDDITEESLLPKVVDEYSATTFEEDSAERSVDEPAKKSNSTPADEQSHDETKSIKDKTEDDSEDLLKGEVGEPLQMAPAAKSVNDAFVDGLDDLDKFMEAVDPPDELDVGAAGSSIQEVLMGQGLQILTKRIAMGLKKLKRNAQDLGRRVSQVFDKLVHRLGDDNEHHRAITFAREETRRATVGLQKLWGRFRLFIADLLSMDKEDEVFSDDALTADIQNLMEKLSDPRRTATGLPNKPLTEKRKSDIDQLVRERMSGKLW